MRIENEKFLLVPFYEAYDNTELRKSYLKWLNDFQIINYINSFELYKPKDLNFVENSFKRFTSDNCHAFFIYDKKEDTYIGTIKLDKIDLFRRSAELGIMIGEKNDWGKNIGYVSCTLLLDYAFSTLGIHRVWGGCSELNIGMNRLFIKLGFRQEGVLVDANFINGKYSDNILYGLLEREYKEKLYNG